VEARLHALKKLRARVKEQAEPDAADWQLAQSTEVSTYYMYYMYSIYCVVVMGYMCTGILFPVQCCIFF
jgi:hypothetical protein